MSDRWCFCAPRIAWADRCLVLFARLSSCIRLTLHQAYSYRRSAQDLSTSVSSLATQSMLTTVKDIESLRLTEFYKQLCSAMAKTRCKTDDDREGWVWVDMEVLKVIEEVLEDSKDSGMDSVLGEGDVVVEVLHEAVGWVQSFRYVSLRAIFGFRHLLTACSRATLSPPAGTRTGDASSFSVRWTSNSTPSGPTRLRSSSCTASSTGRSPDGWRPTSRTRATLP